MIFESSDDRLPPPEVVPVERDGVRYGQAENGRDVGMDQVGGVLVATDVASGKRLWSLAVYGIRSIQNSRQMFNGFTSPRWPSIRTGACVLPTKKGRYS
jgi:hypothetical protein